jgi:hypothetical protein
MNTERQNSFRFKRRCVLAVVFILALMLCVIPVFRAGAQNPSSGTVSPGPGGISAAWDQTVITPGGGVNTEAA